MTYIAQGSAPGNYELRNVSSTKSILNFELSASLHDVRTPALKGHDIYSPGQRPGELRIKNFELSASLHDVRTPALKGLYKYSPGQRPGGGGNYELRISPERATSSRQWV